MDKVGVWHAKGCDPRMLRGLLGAILVNAVGQKDTKVRIYQIFQLLSMYSLKS